MALRDEMPQVSAGSMADIAFLLLIFFLVTTSIETDSGMNRLLPPIDTISTMDVKKKNILAITVNDKGELLIDDDIVALSDLKLLAIEFLDNGGAISSDDFYCSYCKGKRDAKSSDSPLKAIISLITSRDAVYEGYISIQNELLLAYGELRSREANRLYNVDYSSLEAMYNAPDVTSAEKEKAKKKIKAIQNMFPLNLSEANRN
ncbi:biopolymer transporter ExbD [uncultured Maribacter sp.]|uniref:ExbD/TolR family protein n=1 Tax=uncultured Maribacter sp. TaxID=431308 RepID=UPI0026347EAE|nr:biopolymer transporter ExbD [uncultured Maribacter sp.]